MGRKGCSKNRRRRILTVLLAGMLFFVGVTYLQGDVSAFGETEKVRVAVLDYPCYLMMSDDGTVSGFAYEYLQEIQKYTGWEYEYIPMSFEEATKAVENGTIDILAGCQKTEERMEKCNFSEQQMGEGSVVLCTLPEENHYMFNDFKSYEGMRIAVLKATISYEQTKDFFEERGISVEYIEFESDAEAKLALNKGAVDAALMTNIRCEKDYKIIARIQTMPWYFMLNQDRPEIKKQLDEAMYQIHLEEPYYEAKLDDKYFAGVLRQITMSESEQSYIQAAGAITVALSVDMNPIEYYDEEKDTYHGIVVDTFGIISQITGLRFRFVPKEQKEVLQQQMQEGEVQLIGLVAAVGRNVERLNVTLTEAYSNGSVTVVVNSAVADYKELDKRVVVVDSTPTFELIAEDLGYTDIFYVQTFEECVDAVNRGKADISLLPDYCMDRLSNYPRYSNITTYAYPNSLYDYCIGVSEYADERLLSILNKAIISIPEETRMSILLENLTSNQEEESFVDFFYRYNTTIFVVTAIILVIIIGIFTYLSHYRQRINQRLMVAVEQANTASQAKSDFLSRMSHDLRTPLNAVIGYSDPMVNAAATVEEKTDNLAKINMSGKYLMDLINDVLDMVKIENGKLQLNYRPASIESFFKEIDAVIRPLAEKKGITFEIRNFDDQREYVISDQVRVEQIFLNLLNNAIKFTPEGGHISYEVYKIKVEKGRVYNRFRVADDGIGISQEFLPHIFEPFVQEDRKKDEGSGLGLAIVKNLVEELGGFITVSSHPGKGTEFLVDLSFELCDDIMSDLKNSEKDIETHVLEGKRALLCEDHPINTEIAKRMLERVGMQVEVAQNGEQAIEKHSLVGEAYDVILMDIRMPVMNGLETAKRIREQEKKNGSYTPIIAMTANAFEDDREQAAEVGMDGYIAKPIDSKLLYQLLSEICGEKQE